MFNFQRWDQFIASQEKYQFYKNVLNDYDLRYEKLKKKLPEIAVQIKDDKRLAPIADNNYSRS